MLLISSTLRWVMCCAAVNDVALAAVLDVPLLTADVRLSKAPGLSCRVMLIH